MAITAEPYIATDTPRRFRAEETQAPPNALAAPADPLARDGHESLKQELAALPLDIRQSQGTMAHLSDQARTLAGTVGALARGTDQLKSDVGAVRIGAVMARARVAEGLPKVKTPVVVEPVLLGDPA
jgi:outer membrane murein-binding lipoprotein Lpp